MGSHLIVEHIPYVTAEKVVAYGRLALPVTFSGDIVSDESGDHRIWWIGQQPYDELGNVLAGLSPESHAVTADLVANFMISSKPKATGSFATCYEKIVSYVRMVSHPAAAIDPAANPRPGAEWTDIPSDLPFVYPDTGTARAGLADLNAKFRGHRIGIVGLGGTGSYILDHVSKTWVDAIDVFDGDTFDNHNAYRAPGAADIEDLKQRPNKAEHFARQYAHMHTGITGHPVFIASENLELLEGCTFVFLAAGESIEKNAMVCV